MFEFLSLCVCTVKQNLITLPWIFENLVVATLYDLYVQ